MRKWEFTLSIRVEDVLVSFTSSFDTFLSSISNDDGKKMMRDWWKWNNPSGGNVNFNYVDVTVEIDGKKRKILFVAKVLLGIIL